MTLAPWRPVLAHALHRNRARPHCRYLQLATLNLAGKPSNRTVVFRGFVGEALQIVTDGRSEKVQHIRACPWAEACWYFTVTREQFRLAGSLTIVDVDNDPEFLRTAAWQALSPQAQPQFYWPTPGQPRKDGPLTPGEFFSGETFPAEKTFTSRETSAQPPDNFQVLLLHIEHVDYLTLKGNPQERRIYGQSADGWAEQVVNP